ncbi:DUF488 domain-containing protein [Candidatus Woesearchaeota archaeon]|nr:DUF488 domain-containing protein [Candidatus Woesearchaeota archaeon]
MLSTRCIYTTPEPEDGTRISVMSRHTLNDGVTPDERITPDRYTLWLPALAPPSKLIGDYYKRELPWEQFETRYLVHLRTEKIKPEVESIIETALAQDITLLCCEETPEKCHRRLLAEHCKKLEPRLVLLVR